MSHYKVVGRENIHLAAILLSLAIISSLCCILNTMMKRGLNKDIATILKNRVNKMQNRQNRANNRTAPRDGGDEAESRGLRSGGRKASSADTQDIAWKKLAGDVFRTPAYPHIYAAFMGAGAQLIMSYVAVLGMIFILFDNS